MTNYDMTNYEMPNYDMPNYDMPNYEMPNYDPPYVTKSDQISSHRERGNKSKATALAERETAASALVAWHS